MERTELFDLMGELKLYGMKDAFDEIIADSDDCGHLFRLKADSDSDRSRTAFR